MSKIKEAYIRKMILPLSDLFLKRTITKHLSFLEKSQFWSRQELIEFQQKRLRIMINHAVENIPFYSNLFQEIGLKASDIQTVDDLKKIPIIKKAQLKENFPNQLKPKNLKNGSFYKASSSGSTGEPLQYYISKNAYSFNIACGLRAWSWMGYKLGDKYIKISQNQRSNKEKKIQDKLMNNDYLYLNNIDQSSISDAIELIKKAKPKIIRCYPDPLEFIADELIARKEFIPLKAIATTGNVLHEPARIKIEYAFKTKIFDGYSCEGSAPFFQCENNQCYHAAMEYAISEFVDVVEVEKGVFQGRHIVTNLWNEATPFIRYDSQDIIEWDEKQCVCGRQLLNVRKIIGRDNDVLITPNGNRLIVHAFTIYFAKFPEIDQFQIIQDLPDSIQIHLKVNKLFSNVLLFEVKNYWNNRIQDPQLKIEVNVVQNIETYPSGKKRFLIKNC